MNINVTIVPNEQHRPGIGGSDWQFDTAGNLHIRISKMSNPRYEACLTIHEIAEAIFCFYNGITDKDVDAYDIPRDLADPTNTCDRGDEPDCPYRREHSLATACERIAVVELGVPWRAYDDELGAIPINPLPPLPAAAVPDPGPVSTDAPAATE